MTFLYTVVKSLNRYFQRIPTQIMKVQGLKEQILESWSSDQIWTQPTLSFWHFQNSVLGSHFRGQIWEFICFHKCTCDIPLERAPRNLSNAYSQTSWRFKDWEKKTLESWPVTNFEPSQHLVFGISRNQFWDPIFGVDFEGANRFINVLSIYNCKELQDLFPTHPHKASKDSRILRTKASN